MLVAAALALGFAQRARAAAPSVAFPDDAGHVDVTKPPYNAKPDGVTDCTEAIQRALLEHGSQIIYLPKGTYLVSETLHWTGRCTRTVLQGESESGTVIKLADRCPGFTNPSAPRPVIVTGYFPPQRFRNAIRNLTVDTGVGNDGAIGIRFNASNQGQMNTVTIRSGSGSGVIGLDMGYTGDVGPLLVKRLTVDGFDVGLYTAHATAAQTLEFVTLRRQRVCGWVNDGQAVAMRGLVSENTVTAFRNKRGSGMVTLLDADLRGEGDTAASVPAILNESGLYARNVSTAGYRQAIENRAGTGVGVDEASAAEFTSHPPLRLFPSPDRALNLPVAETPDIPYDPPETWTSVAKFPPKPAKVEKKRTRNGVEQTYTVDVLDWTESVQSAIDSCATTVYFPRDNGTGKPYEILGTVKVRGAVRRIIGMEGTFGQESRPVFEVVDGEAPAVVIERFDWMYAHVLVRTATRRDVIVGAVTVYLDVGPEGRTFVEDAVTHLRVRPGGTVYLRQWNTEYTNEARHNALGIQTPDPKDHPGNLNEGGTLWALGFKSEGDGVLLTTRDGGRSEVLGGLVYANKNSNPDKRGFVVRDGSLSLSVGEWVSRQQPFHMIEETRSGETRRLAPGVAPDRGGGSLVVLYNGYDGPESVAPAAPGGQAAEPAPADESAVEGRGLSASYFAGDFEDVLVSRVEAVDADWKETPPLADGTSVRTVRWRGTLEARKTGMHGFNLAMRDSRLLLDGVPVVDAWRNGARYRSGGMWLEAGRRYAVLLEYRPAGSRERVRWTWSEPGSRSVPVPASVLRPDAAPLPEVRLAFEPATVPEKGGTAVLTATRTGDLSKPLTVSLAPRADLAGQGVLSLAARGSAVEGRDITPLPETIEIPAGASSSSFTLETRDNDVVDAARRMSVEAMPAPGYLVAGGPAAVEIEDDDRPAPAGGTGLLGTYFAGRDFTEPLVTRVDPVIRFGWDKKAPVPGIDTKKGFAIRWEGEIVPQFSETYRLTLDAGVYCAARVWVDDQLVIELTNPGTQPKGKFGQAGRGLHSARIPLKAGERHALRIEYVGLNFYGQNVRLLWASPSQCEETVPATQLLPKTVPEP